MQVTALIGLVLLVVVILGGLYDEPRAWVGAPILGILLLVVTAQFSRLTIPALREMERNPPGGAQPRGPSRKEWTIIVALSLVPTIALMALGFGVTMLAFFVIGGRYIIWPLLRRRR